MKIHFYKYQGTGNDFILLDWRYFIYPLDFKMIKRLCDRKKGIGADGLILLTSSLEANFGMKYYNADGKESSFCGNGGRCITAFANKLDITGNSATFEYKKTIYHSEYEGNMVKLKMGNVSSIVSDGDAFFLDTGSPHYVCFVEDVAQVDVFSRGREIRNSEKYKDTGGVNVNFVEIVSDTTIKVRTYERGVEDETLSCGTGVTAAAISAYFSQKIDSTKVKIDTIGGELYVHFSKDGSIYKDVYLIGSVEKVFEGVISI